MMFKVVAIFPTYLSLKCNLLTPDPKTLVIRFMNQFFSMILSGSNHLVEGPETVLDVHHGEPGVLVQVALVHASLERVVEDLNRVV